MLESSAAAAYAFVTGDVKTASVEAVTTEDPALLSIERYDQRASVGLPASGGYLSLGWQREKGSYVRRIRWGVSPEDAGLAFPGRFSGSVEPPHKPAIPGFRYVMSEKHAGSAYLGLWHSTSGNQALVAFFSGDGPRCGQSKFYEEVGRLPIKPALLSIPFEHHGMDFAMIFKTSPRQLMIGHYYLESIGKYHRLVYPCRGNDLKQPGSN